MVEILDDLLKKKSTALLWWELSWSRETKVQHQLHEVGIREITTKRGKVKVKKTIFVWDIKTKRRKVKEKKKQKILFEI